MIYSIDDNRVYSYACTRFQIVTCLKNSVGLGSANRKSSKTLQSYAFKLQTLYFAIWSWT